MVLDRSGWKQIVGNSLFFHFFIGNYVFIVNGFLAMTSERWKGDFIYLIGQHALKGYNQIYSFRFENVCSEHIN